MRSLYCLAAVVALTLLAPRAHAVPCSMGGSGIGPFELALEFGAPFLSGSLTVYDRSGTAIIPDRVIKDGSDQTPSATTQLSGSFAGVCDALVSFSEGGFAVPGPQDYVFYSGDDLGPYTVEISVSTSGQVSPSVHRIAYGWLPPEQPRGSFFNPEGAQDQDAYFEIEASRVRVSPFPFWATNNGGPRFMDEAAPDGGWIFPYHRLAYCEALSCGPQNFTGGPGKPFLMPVDAAQDYDQPFTKELTPALDMTFPEGMFGGFSGASAQMVWDAHALTLAFAGGTGIESATSRFTIDGMELTAADPATGWHGIRVDGPDAELTLDGATVSGVVYDPCTGGVCGVRPAHASVEALGGATVTLAGDGLTPTVITGGTFAHGVLASGVGYRDNGNAVDIVPSTVFFGAYLVEGAARVEDHDGYGAVAQGGGRVAAQDPSAVIQRNTLGGVRASGAGSVVDVWTNSDVVLNLGYGATAVSDGKVTASSPELVDGQTNQGNADVSDNQGGLNAASDGFVFTGGCYSDGTCTPRPVAAEFNNQNGQPDARARSLGRVQAQVTYWGANRELGDLVLSPDPSGPDRISVEPICQDPNGVDCSGTGAARSSGTARTGAGSHEESASVLLPPAAEVRALLATGDADTAAALLADALSAPSADLPELYVAATDLATIGLSEPLAASFATATSEAGLWPQRALAVSALYAGQPETAALHAAALAATEAHRGFGHGLLVRLACDARDEAQALVALGAFSAVAGEDEADALADATALVAVTFPEADLSGALARTAEAKTASVQAAAPAALAAAPNPSAAGATVTLRAAEGSEATVAVYDALGRRVAVLHEGTLSGETEAFELAGSGLAAGLYVVTAQVTGPGGAVSTEAVRWTRTR